MRCFAPLLLLAALLSATPARAGWTDDWDRLLRAHVAETGVRYAAWAASPEDRAALANVARAIAQAPRPEDPRERLAFYVNAYNVWMITFVLERYPIASVRDLAPEFGIFKQPRAQVHGRTVSLDQIEKELILGEFPDPRIHFAVNCAARSCPPLAAFAFRGPEVERQLDQVTRRAVGLNSVVLVDHRGAVIRFSKIFEWYAGDFAPAGGAFAFIQRHREKPLPDRYVRDWQDYDWALNDVR